MAKSIIDIEVNDGPFNEFQESFAKYQAALLKTPDAWNKASKTTAESSSIVDKLSGKVKDVNSNVGKMVPSVDKFNKATKSSDMTMARMVKSSKSIATNIKDTTLSLIKWTGIFSAVSGLLGVGGFFGIDKLAASASNDRFRAQGLGVNTGELNAAKINYSKVVGDPAGTLGAIRDAQYDLSKRWTFSAMGINPQGKDAGKLIGPMVKAARKTFIASGSTQQGAEAHGLTQFFSMDDLVRLKSMSEAEVNAMVKRADADTKAMSLSDKVSRSWQNLNQQLDRSEQQIKRTFILGLVPLAGPLAKLSDAFQQAVAEIMKTKQMGKWIDELGSGIKHFASYLTSPEFKTDIQAFMEALDDAGGAIYNFAQRIGKLFGTGEVTLKASQYHKLNDIAKTDPKLASALTNFLENPSRQKYNSSVVQRWVETHPSAVIRGPKQIAATQQEILKRFGLISGPSGYTVNNIPASSPQTSGAYNAPNHNPGNLRRWGNYPTSGGFAQFPNDTVGLRAMAKQLRIYNSKKINTINDIIKKYAPMEDNNDVGSYIRDVTKRTGFRADQQLNLNDNKTLATLVSAMTKHENVKSNFTPNTVVTILNNTGGNAIVTTNQLAH